MLKFLQKIKRNVDNKKLNLGFSFNFNLVFLLFNFIGNSMIFITIIQFECLDKFINVLSLILYSYIILVHIFLLFKSKNPFIDANSSFFALIYLFLITWM